MKLQKIQIFGGAAIVIAFAFGVVGAFAFDHGAGPHACRLQSRPTVASVSPSAQLSDEEAQVQKLPADEQAAYRQSQAMSAAAP